MALCIDDPDKQMADTILQMPWTRSPAMSNVVAIRAGRFRISLFSSKEPLRNYNDVNNQQDATTFSFINLLNPALHVSDEKFAHPQELFFPVYAAFGTIHRHCCRSVPRLRWNSVPSQTRHRSAAVSVHCT